MRYHGTSSSLCRARRKQIQKPRRSDREPTAAARVPVGPSQKDEMQLDKRHTPVTRIVTSSSYRRIRSLHVSSNRAFNLSKSRCQHSCHQQQEQQKQQSLWVLLKGRWGVLLLPLTFSANGRVLLVLAREQMDHQTAIVQIRVSCGAAEQVQSAPAGASVCSVGSSSRRRRCWWRGALHSQNPVPLLRNKPGSGTTGGILHHDSETCHARRVRAP